MHGSENYHCWGYPGPSATVFLVLTLIYKSQMGSFQRKLYLSRLQRGPTISRVGGSNQLLIPYQDQNNLYSVRNYTGNNLQAPVATGSCFDGRKLWPSM